MKTLIVKMTVSNENIDSLKSNLQEFLGDAPISIPKVSYEVVEFLDDVFIELIKNVFTSIVGNAHDLGDSYKVVHDMLMDEYGSDYINVEVPEIRNMVLKYIVGKIK